MAENENVRLFGRFWPSRSKKVAGITLRIMARDTPAGAEVLVSDLQLQPGRYITGITLHTQDLGVEPVTGWQWRNGIVYGDQTLIVVADAESASPLRWEITRANGNCQIGDYHLGHVHPTAILDGHASTATQGAGMPPHLTARADIDITVKLEGRAALSCWFRGLASADPSQPPPPDPDPLDPDPPMPDPGEPPVEEPPETPPPGDDDEDPATTVLLDDDFTAAPVGGGITPYLKDAWKATVSSVTMGRAEVVQEGGNRFVRVHYPKGKTGATNSGASWRAHLAPAEEMTARYRVRFDPGFHWTEGGKLPGLAGGTSPTGGKPSPKGFSARYMWKPNGGLIVYLYHSEQPGQYGQSFNLNQNLARNEWHTLEQRIKLNTPGQANGVLEVWVNGVPALTKSNMRWRLGQDDWLIDSFYFSTFHGGSSAEYQPNRDNRIDFDDVKITAGTHG